MLSAGKESNEVAITRIMDPKIENESIFLSQEL